MSANIALTPPKEKKKNGKHRSLTLRERRFIKYLPESKSISEAMRKAGYSESVVRLGSQESPIRKPVVLTAMQKAYEKQGITDEMLAKTQFEGLKADKVISATIISGNGEEMKDADSMSKDFIEVPDYAVRHKYLDTAHKIRSDYPSEKVEVEHTGQVLVVHVPVKGEGWEPKRIE